MVVPRVVQTDTQMWTSVSKCFPLGLHTSCDAVTLSIVPSDSFVLRILIPFLPLSLIMAVTLGVGPAISITITPQTQKLVVLWAMMVQVHVH